jgi:hypothetical protein
MLLPYAPDGVPKDQVSSEFIAKENERCANDFDDRTKISIGDKDRPCKSGDGAGIDATMYECNGHLFRRSLESHQVPKAKHCREIAKRNAGPEDYFGIDWKIEMGEYFQGIQRCCERQQRRWEMYEHYVNGMPEELSPHQIA